MFPRSFQARPVAQLSSAPWSNIQLLPMHFSLPCSRKGNSKLRLEWNTRLESSEWKMNRAGIARDFCSTLTSCSSEFCDLKTPFPTGCILRNEILWCSSQSGQWITSYRSAQNRNPGLTGKLLALLSRCLHIFWICGIHIWEATNWSIGGDLNYWGILGVEGISKSYFL